ncbi:hypothetical protein [Streptomyces sp. NPDC092307]|uniref:hypothetical protein n=1 Tax=Streptomyces sp. NPDC092307 TaxID=3366013 RepID=UPI00382B26F2
MAVDGEAADGRAGGAEVAKVDSERAAAWQRQWPRIRRLLYDGDPVVRRAALMLISDRTAPLLERWHEETDPSVQVARLPALGRAAADEDLMQEAGAEAGAEVRAVLDALLHGEDPVLGVAAPWSPRPRSTRGRWCAPPRCCWRCSPIPHSPRGSTRAPATDTSPRRSGKPLTAWGAADRRFSEYGDYRAVLQGEEIRARIDRVLALP